MIRIVEQLFGRDPEAIVFGVMFKPMSGKANTWLNASTFVKHISSDEKLDSEAERESQRAPGAYTHLACVFFWAGISWIHAWLHNVAEEHTFAKCFHSISAPFPGGQPAADSSSSTEPR